MIIKKYSGSAWEPQYPKTIVDRIYTGDASTQVFDPSTDKLKVAYLPDVVIGGMNFEGAISLSGGKNGDDLNTAGLATVGDYLIVTTGGDIVNTGSPIITLAVQAPGDEGDSSIPVTLEAGDWIVLQEISGNTYTVAIVNNTYQDATTSAKGIVRLSNATTYASLSGTDVVTETVLKTTIDNASFASASNSQSVTLTGAVTGSGTITNYGDISIATTATSDPTLTLAGDATGSATFTNLGNATLTVAVANDSHTHDGRYYTESEMDTFLAAKQDTVTAGSGIGKTLATLSVAGGEGITAETDGVRMTYPLYVQTATPSTSVTNAIWYDIN